MWKYLKNGTRSCYCSKCNVLIGAKKLLVRHLDEVHGMTLDDYGIKIHNLYTLPKCGNPDCGEAMSYLIKFNRFKVYCNYSCSMKVKAKNKSISHIDSIKNR